MRNYAMPFTRLGGYAVDFGQGCQDDEVTGCEMFDLGAGGVRLGDTDARRHKAIQTAATR